MKTFALLIVLVAFAWAEEIKPAPCNRRWMGGDSQVCVCTEQICDHLPTFSKTEKGVVSIFTTSKDGDRFEAKTAHFSGSENGAHLNVDLRGRFQKILGFGGAFTDSSGSMMAKLNSDVQWRLIKDYFGLDGLEYNMARVTIGGSDFSTRPYSYDENANDESLSHWTLQDEDIHWKIPFMKMAHDVKHDLKIIATPWNPPSWMKRNKQINHGGLLIGEPGGKYYKLYAEYLYKFIEQYEKQGLTMWGLTLQNEPLTGYDNNYPFNSLLMDGNIQRDFIKKDMGPLLQQRGHGKDKLKILAYDHNIDKVEEFAGAILSDSSAANYTYGVAYHWYANDKFPHREPLDRMHKRFGNFPLLGTEACHGLGAIGTWHHATDYANTIIQDLRHFSSGWIDWNLVLDDQGGPSWVHTRLDAPILVPGHAHEYFKQPKYYAMAHFSKLMVEGSEHVKLDGGMPNNVNGVAVQRPDGGIVVTMTNTNDHSEHITLSEGQAKGSFELKAQSITTFVWYP